MTIKKCNKIGISLNKIFSRKIYMIKIFQIMSFQINKKIHKKIFLYIQP